MGVETLDFGFASPKRHFLARNRVVWRILRQNRCTRLGCSFFQEPPPQKKSSRVTLCRGARNHACAEPKSIWIKFGMLVDIPDVVTYTNFGDHRLRGFWVTRGQISPSPIDFHRRPYNTLTLPCDVRRTIPFKERCQISWMLVKYLINLSSLLDETVTTASIYFY